MKDEYVEYSNHIAIWKDVVDNINRIVDIITQAPPTPDWSSEIWHTISSLDDIDINPAKNLIIVKYWDGNENGDRCTIQFPTTYLKMKSNAIEKDLKTKQEQEEQKKKRKKEKEEKEKRYKEYLKLKEEFEGKDERK